MMLRELNCVRSQQTLRVSPNIISTTDYFGSIIYKNDTLQFVNHQEGRIRPLYKTGFPLVYKYDYYIKDHLNNIRMVLTEQTDFTTYSATMETDNAQVESQLFSNLDNTRSAKPAGYPTDEMTPRQPIGRQIVP